MNQTPIWMLLGQYTRFKGRVVFFPGEIYFFKFGGKERRKQGLTAANLLFILMLQFTGALLHAHYCQETVILQSISLIPLFKSNAAFLSILSAGNSFKVKESSLPQVL